MNRRAITRKAVPRVEAMESRELLSMYGAAWSMPARPHARATASAFAAPAAVNNQVTDPTGIPTPHEALRTRFSAALSGPFRVGPGRYSTEAAQIFLKGGGTSNTFIHGDYQLRIILPTDPATPPTGAMTIFDRNIMAGSQLGLLLTGSPTERDALGRPTRMAFTVDVTVSAGIFTQASGEGTVEIRYLDRGRNQGIAKVLVQGRVYTLGTTYSLATANFA